jgi:hypothetical protein
MDELYILGASIHYILFDRRQCNEQILSKNMAQKNKRRENETGWSFIFS